jgi:Aldehyde dehydrogenase family
VALIFRVRNEQEAIKLANDSPYGLDGTVITKDLERGKRVALRSCPLAGSRTLASAMSFPSLASANS